jgi:transposase
VRLARELVARCRSPNRIIVELDHELAQRTAELAPALLELPGCGAVTPAKLLAEIGPIDRFKSDAQLARHGGVAPLEASSGRVQRHRLDRGGPSAQLRALPDRDHTVALPPRRTCVPRTQTSRG